MSKSKKFRGSGKKVANAVIFNSPAAVYRIKYDEPVIVHIGEIVKEVQQYHSDGTVTVEGEVVKADE